MQKPYIQHDSKVMNTDSQFTHVMALALDPRSGYKEGMIRCITHREGSVSAAGFVDRSELHKVRGDTLEHFEIFEKVVFKNEDTIINGLKGKLDFIGLEDPDLWIDEQSAMLHMYFTVPLFDMTDKKKTKIHLGHAFGKDLDSLEMTTPVLLADDIGCAKELSIAPVNKNGVRLNLVESNKREEDFNYSIVRVAITEDMGANWKFGDIVFHPKEHDIPWIGGHASPGPLFSQEFVDVGVGKRLGIINGREANKIVDGKTKYGMFSVGLFIYDYEEGKIDWVSPEPLIQDSEAVTITFASQFIETVPGEGILYAHVDDSFVRAYTLKAQWLRPLLPEIADLEK
jgi:hypothetical protein